MRTRPMVLASILAGLVFGTLRARPSDIPDRELVPATTEPAGTVPFELYRGYFMVAHGSVGPLKNLNFYLDTGTTPAILDARIAKKLSLPGDESANIVVLGGRTAGKRISLPSIEMGPLKRTNLQVVTTDLSFFQKYVPVRIDAIVGLDLLGQGPFVIDYSAHVIRFGPAPALAVSVPLRLDQGLAVFDAEIDHKPVHLLFDTGAYPLVLFAKTPQTGASSEGSEPNPTDKSIQLRTLRLGPEEFRHKPSFVAPNPKPSQLDFDGLLSPAALGVSRISVDLNQGVLAFSR